MAKEVNITSGVVVVSPSLNEAAAAHLIKVTIEELGKRGGASWASATQINTRGSTIVFALTEDEMVVEHDISENGDQRDEGLLIRTQQISDGQTVFWIVAPRGCHGLSRPFTPHPVPIRVPRKIGELWRADGGDWSDGRFQLQASRMIWPDPAAHARVR